MTGIYRAVMFVAVCVCSFSVFAQQAPARAEQSAIPFKENSSFMADLGMSVSAIIIFLIVAGLVMLYLKKFNPTLKLDTDRTKHIEIIEIKRLSTRTVSFLVQVKGVDVFVVQNAESVSVIKLDADKE